LGGDVTKLDVTTAVDNNGKPQKPNSAGAVLAALSGMDSLNGSMQGTIDFLARKVGRPLEQNILDEALMLGAAAADAKLQFSEKFVIDEVSNLLNAVNSSDGYSISSIAKDNVIDKNDPLFTVGSAITFKVPPGKLAGDFEMWLPGASTKGTGTITIDAATNMASYTLTAADADALNAMNDGLKSFQVRAAGSTFASPDLTVRYVYVNKADDAPTAITFSNAVTSLGEATITGGKKVADIAVVDIDGYKGTVPTVNDSNFEVKEVGGKYELWLKSGVVLDFESGITSLTTTVSAGGVDSAAFTLTVTDVNEAPVTKGSIPAQTAIKNFAFSLDVATFFKDMDTGDVLTYAVTKGTLPAGLSLDPTTGLISGTPGADKDPVSVTIKATDKAGLSVSQTFDLGVVTTALALASESDSGVKGDGITNVSTPTFIGVVAAGAKVEVWDTINGSTTKVGTATADNKGVKATMSPGGPLYALWMIKSRLVESSLKNLRTPWSIAVFTPWMRSPSTTSYCCR
jgi:hypothetical protein